MTPAPAARAAVGCSGAPGAGGGSGFRTTITEPGTGHMCVCVAVCTPRSLGNPSRNTQSDTKKEEKGGKGNPCETAFHVKTTALVMCFLGFSVVL